MIALKSWFHFVSATFFKAATELLYVASYPIQDGGPQGRPSEEAVEPEEVSSWPSDQDGQVRFGEGLE